MMRKTFLLAAALSALSSWAGVPVTLVNNSNGQFADEEIYVAIIGEQKGTGYIYYDLAASSEEAAVKRLDERANTMPGTGAFPMYADVFTRLSDIPGKVISLGDTYACRMFISFRSPMYIHAFDNGYAGADLNNPGDANAPVRWELIEFTNQEETDELWINTTRVDAFQYPMGLEVWSEGVYPYTRRGEIVDYATVIGRWEQAYAGTPYADCLYNLITKDDVGGIIKQPSKVASVKSQNLFGGYIDRIWDFFKTNTANIDMGLLGRWTGKVEGESFVLTCAEGHYWKPGSKATVEGRPTTENVIEGAGVFASGDEVSKTVQSMFCAAFNRGMFRATTALQDWNPEGETKAFTGGSEYPCNEYVKFFHDPAITASGGHTYAFAYDDTYDQSATCYANHPTRATVTIGGFAEGVGVPAAPKAVVTADPGACKAGETVEFTATVDGGDYEVSKVVIKVDGGELATVPVSRGAQSVHRAVWTAAAEGSHTVHAEVTAEGAVYKSAPLEFMVTAEGGREPGQGTDPAPDGAAVVKDFTAGDSSEGSFAAPYSISIAPSGSGVLVTAKFEGEYTGFAGPWLWNLTAGLEETPMEPDGKGGYECRIPDLLPGATITVAVKIAYAGGLGVSPHITYTVPVVNAVDVTVADGCGFVIYPNPVDSDLNVAVAGAGEISVWTLGGACVARRDVQGAATLDVSALQAGVYLVAFRPAEGGSVAVRKLMKR